MAYRVINGVAVTTGDPVGDPRHHDRAVREFTELCAQQSWTPCLYSVGARIAELARGLGWTRCRWPRRPSSRWAG